jgi:hypothetical protein
MEGARSKLRRIVRDNPIRCADADAGIERNCEVLEGLSHELGNLLTVVSGWVQYWEETGALAMNDTPAARYLYIGVGRIRYSLNRLAYRGGKALPEIIALMPGQLSDVRSANLAVVDVNRLVAATLDAIDPRVAGGYVLKTNLEPEPWPVIADFWALDIVLVNLLMDVVSTNVPGTTVIIETANVETREILVGVDGTLPPGRYVAISVRDVLGPGIHDEPADVQAVAMDGRPNQGFPVSLGILHEHAGLLQMRRSPRGEMASAVFLPALQRSSAASPSSLVM